MPLKLAKRHGSPCWYIRGSIRGVVVDESTGIRIAQKKDADAVLVKRSAEVLHRSIHGDSASRTFADAALKYMEAGGEREHMEPLLRHFGRSKVGQIGQAELEEAARKLAPRCSPSTVNRKIYTPAVAVLHHAARLKWCAKPVIARPRQPAGRVRSITPEEAERLLAASAEHLRPLVVFLLGTGARLSEALYLDWRDVDLSRGHVIFRDTKNGETRGVPLHPRVIAALANLPWDRKGTVFRKPVGMLNGRPRKWLAYEERSGGGGQVKTAWAGMCRRAGIVDFTPHDCRHTWATWHYQANKDVRALMELGGWKTLGMVARYTHVNASHLAPSIAKMWDFPGDLEYSDPVNPLPQKA